MLIPPQSRKLWIRSTVWGLWIFAGALTYHAVRSFSINLVLINRAITFAGLSLILLSHALSGLSYFWGIGKTKLGYRKPLGVVGFVIVTIHALISTVIFSDGLTTLVFFLGNPLPFILSITVLILFSYMFIISNFGIPARLGAQRWRKLLRITGYLAITLIMGHISLLAFAEWRMWFTAFSPVLPPPSLILVVFSLATLALRFALWIAVRNKQHEMHETLDDNHVHQALPSNPSPPASPPPTL